MDPSRWDRLAELFGRACEIPEDEREEFVDRETRDDPELRAELLTLLDASAGTDHLNRLREELLGPDVRGVLPEVESGAEPTDPWIGRTVSHYQIIERIGGGGMGVVYRARDLQLDRPVAIKFIAPEISRDPEAKRRFLHEARAASALDHPNICVIHEFGETDTGRLFMAMAAYDGETLRTRIARGPLSETEALDVGEQIARALTVAHERGVVHRDIKPANVFVTRDGVVKLLDFGLARTGDASVSQAGMIRGTVGYMSPEQTRGEPADEKTDIWAAGVVLFEMLAGERPFAAANPQAEIHCIQTKKTDLRAKRPDVAVETEAVVRKALSRDPADRFTNGSELLDALRQCRSALVSLGRARAPSSARYALVGAAFVVVLAVAILLAERAVTQTESAAPPVTPSVSHILWVDDNPENNADVVLRLRDLGVQVTTALSTAEGVERYDPAVFQLVVSDVGRNEGPDDEYVGRAGFNLFEQLRAQHENVPLVFCTSARNVAMHREEALRAGVIDILSKCENVLFMIGM